MQSTNLGIVRLRTLTAFTKMKFGDLEDLSVHEVMDMGYHNYLVWVYYNISHITFDESLLKQLGIVERIQKPGKNLRVYENVKYNLRRKDKTFNSISN